MTAASRRSGQFQASYLVQKFVTLFIPPRAARMTCNSCTWAIASAAIIPLWLSATRRLALPGLCFAGLAVAALIKPFPSADHRLVERIWR